MNKIEITTEPISVNRLYTGRRFLTPDGRSTKEAMAWEVKSQWKKEVITGEVHVNVVFYLKDNRKDLDGLLKALFDCLTGVVWKDDRQVVGLHAFKKIDKQRPRIEIILTI